MPSYRYYFLDSAGHIADFHLIECETDNQAQVRADRLLAACGYPGIEVWDRDRKVYRARKPEARCITQNEERARLGSSRAT